MAAFNATVKNGTKTHHVYEHDRDIKRASSSCGCVEILNVNGRNLLFSYKAPEIMQKTKDHPMYKGYLEVSKLVKVLDTEKEFSLQVNMTITE
jgi:hypothetical protein